MGSRRTQFRLDRANADLANNGAAPYSFYRTFDLTGYNLAAVTLSGAWAIDDAGTLNLNGHQIASLGGGNTGALNSFSIAAGSPFLNPGLNTLSITITSDDQSLEGVRFEGSVSTVPIPATSLFSGFTLSYSEDMAPATINNLANYVLKDSSNNVYHLAAPNYTSGSTAAYSIADGPLQPGNYTLAIGGLTDRFGNAISAANYQFTVAGVAGFTDLGRTSNNAATPTALTLSEDPAGTGLFQAGGRGALLNNSDVDYWTFNGTAGNLVTIATQNPGSAGGTGLSYIITKPNGTQLTSFVTDYTGNAESAPIALPTTGTYTVSVHIYYGYHGEYRFRIVSAAPPLQLDTEPNNTIGTANALTLTTNGSSQVANVAGTLLTPSDLNYFNLGSIAAGQSVLLSTLLPSTSLLNPVVSIYNHAGTYINKTTGRAFDGVGQIDITVPDTYYALVSGTNGTGGLLAQYVLNVQIVPTSSLAKLPNLEVTNIALPTASNIQSGQPITFSWTVTNAGQAPTNVVNWSDRAVLSLDTVYGDGDDVPLAIGPNNGVYGHTGVLNPGDSYTVTETVTLPDGISGNFYLLVQTDNTQQVAESPIARGDGTTVSTGGANGNGTITVNLAQYPDLVIQGLKVNGPNGDGTFSVSWNTVNSGTGAIANGWKENVVVTDVTSGASIANSVLSFAGTLAGNGGSAAHTLPLTGNFTVDGAGHFLVSVTTNSDQAIFENNASGHVAAVQNDSAQTTFDATRDLQVAGIAVTPPSPQSGGAVTVNWNDTNTGLLATSGSWSDTISIVNTTTATTVASSTVSYNAAVRGNLAPGTAAPQSFTFNLPDGDLGTGVFKVTITANATASMAEYNAAGTATTNNTASANFNAALGNYADLQVANLAVSPNAPSAGSNLTITWNDSNTGHANLGKAFYDNITVVNTTTGQTLTSTNLLYDATQAGAAIAAGGSSAQRQFQFTLPAGTAGAGVLQVSVTTDALNNIFEYAYATTPGGHQVGESNNVSTVSATSTLSNPPSLQVTNLALSPSALQSGTQLTVTWNDKNTGTGILNQSFNDHVTIVSTTTNQTLLDTDDFYNATQSGAAIAAGASSAQRQYLFTLPDGDPGVGNLSVTVTADVHNVFPSPATGHSATVTTSATLANYADLQVTSLTATPTAAFTSGHVNFQWNDSNTGKASVTQAFSDHIVVVNTTTHQTLFTTDVPYNAAQAGAAIAVGGSVQRQFGFTVPDGTAAVGTLQVTVTTNFNNAVFEYNYGTIPGGHEVAQGNNAAGTSFTTQISAVSGFASRQRGLTTGDRGDRPRLGRGCSG